MNLKVVGGTLCVLALVAIFYVHDRKHEAPPAPVVVAVPYVASVPTPATVPLPTKVTPKLTPKVTPLKKITPVAKKPLDMSLSCRAARSIVAGKTPAQIQLMREQYHTTDEQIAQYKHCF